MDTPSIPPQLQPFPPTPRKGLSTGCIIGLVIGIGLVFVVAVVTVLAALAMPAYSTVRIVQSRSVMLSFVMAMKSYNVEYENKLPVEGFPNRDEHELLRTRGAFLKMLFGQDDKLNPRMIQFFDPPPYRANNDCGYRVVNGEPILTDPWGEPYYFMLDFSGNGVISNPDKRPGQPETILGMIIVFSSGPDRDPSTWKDNIVSWR